MCETVFLFACSMYLFKLGRAPQILDLIGKIKFTGEDKNCLLLKFSNIQSGVVAFCNKK